MHTETLFTDDTAGLAFIWNRSLTVNVYRFEHGDDTQQDWDEIDVFMFAAVNDDDKPTEERVRRSCERYVTEYLTGEVE